MAKLIVANWKMNPRSFAEAESLAKTFDAPSVVMAPPFPFIEAVGRKIKKASLGAQDLFWEDQGAFTGEVSGSQLKDLGVKYVIVGHSERRRLGDTNEMVTKKTRAALTAGLIPIICVGESRSEHDAGQAKEVVKRQLLEVLNGLRQATSDMRQASLIVAYEPVWAISTERGAQTDTPENAVAMIKFIKAIIHHSPFTIKLIYGGSVTAANAESFLKHREIEGVLVGGASLKPNAFKKIIETAQRY